MGLKYALLDLHGEPLGFHDTEEDARGALEMLGNPSDVGIKLIDAPDREGARTAALRYLTRLAETFPGGYR